MGIVYRRRIRFLIGMAAFFLLFSPGLICPLTASAKTTAQTKTGTTVKKEKKGWHKVTVKGEAEYYYVKADGKRASGWLTIGGKTYYFKKKTGYRCTGIKKIKGKRYYFSKKGVRKTGWRTVNHKTYYFDPTGGYALTGLRKIGKYRYYFSDNGVMKTGWAKEGEKYYYFNEENGRAVKGLQNIEGSYYYFTAKNVMKTGLVKIGEAIYYFRKDGRMLFNGFTPGGRYAHTDGKILNTASLKSFLKTAMGPVGHTLYIWGGGWSTSDDGNASGIDAVTIGVPARWKQFFDSYGSGYDYNNTRFQTRDGLDCSGYVGWTLYNTFNTSSGNAGFVMLAENMASTYASYGWGSYTPAGSFSDFRPGDIMSLSSGHVYIVVGQCSDGSVVLLHSSPPGVMITGTSTPSGSKFSMATALSSRYMRKYFPEYYSKFSDKLSRGSSYLHQYSRMRWYTNSNRLMTDPDGFANKNAQQVLQKLLGNA